MALIPDIIMSGQNATDKLKLYLDQKPKGNNPDCIVGWYDRVKYNKPVTITVEDLRDIVLYISTLTTDKDRMDALETTEVWAGITGEYDFLAKYCGGNGYNESVRQIADNIIIDNKLK